MIKFKEGVNEKEIEMLTPTMWALLQIFSLEASYQLEDTLITSIKEKVHGRVSKTHSEGRAVDIRTRDMKINPKEFCDKFNEKYKRIGAISAKSGQQTPCVYHDSGNGWHIHLQSIN